VTPVSARAVLSALAAERLRGADDAPVGRFENDGDVFAFGEFLVEAQRGSCQLAMLAFLKIF